MTTTPRLVNLTMHPVTILDAGGSSLASWQPSGMVARLVESVAPRPALQTDQGTIPTSTVSYRSVVLGLPEATPGVVYIVSRVLAAAVARSDLVFPFPELRDPDGHIRGAGGLGFFEPAPHEVGL